MWELGICVHSIEIAKFVYQTLKQSAETLDACVTCYEEFDRFYILFGCPTVRQGEAKILIERCVVSVICERFKDDFLSENLRFPIRENLSMTAFKTALLNFDKETDCFIISKNLVLEKNLHLDSFYLFRLKPLREKWAELIALANENCEYLGSPDAFFDLLRFLIDNLTVEQEKIDVFKNEQGYVLKAEACTREHLSQEGLVSSLIGMCPKKINFFCRDDVVNFVYKIFDERVNLCGTSIEKLHT